jgi:diacylglycerol kinase family enzyme
MKPTIQRIIVAGDGTIKMVAEAMENYDVIIGILGSGSANGLAVDLNLPTNRRKFRNRFHNDYMEIDTLQSTKKKHSFK